MTKNFKYIILLVGFCYACKPVIEHELVNTDERLKLVNGVMFFNEAIFNGNILSYYKNGVLKSDVQYIDGRKHGYEKQWHTDASLREERYYKNGFKSGIHKGWWRDKTLKFEYHFNEKGEYEGRVREWYKTGQLFRDFNYVSGKEVGRQRLWKVDGTIKANYEVVNQERFGLIGLKKCYTVTVNSDEVN
ncbi:hypothetical protein VOI54_15040 [Tamlana sp. 2201CG12-4]|uniref:toxin-antitoxin system YwqK family antitoxin n=1 Tax=Tamlana sp. 2201CG12-4 TaxID=3112582 RepID=UPI002DBB593A|nr:hypothetical protein [Tamlana sp. 2201CG12-4]MEC3908344.1 hypothetical protein [Tamlana sp. 2201CG12-4]